MNNLKDRAVDEVNTMKKAIESLGYLHIDGDKALFLMNLIEDQAARIEEQDEELKNMACNHIDISMESHEIESLIEEAENTEINNNIITVARCLGKICRVLRILNNKEGRND